MADSMSGDVPADREARVSVIIRALIEAPNLSVDRRIRNLSRSGACCDNMGDLKAGMRVLVSMGALTQIHAEVMWANERLAGLRFDGLPVNLDAARKPRSAVPPVSAPGAGWLAQIDDPYRRHG